MAFLFAFECPRTEFLDLTALHSSGSRRSSASGSSSLLGRVGSLFSSKSKDKDKEVAASASSAGVSGSMSGYGDALTLPPPLPPLTGDTASNLAIATTARERLRQALLLKKRPSALVASSSSSSSSAATPVTVDDVRLAAVREYLPFSAALAVEYKSLGESHRQSVLRSGEVAWSSAIWAGAHPDPKTDIVPFFRDYGGANLEMEHAHALLTYALLLYRQAGQLTFHAQQLALKLQPASSSFITIVPWFLNALRRQEQDEADANAKANGTVPEKLPDSGATKPRMFNPLSAVPETSLVSSSLLSAPRSQQEINELKTSVLAMRREAVALLRQAAGVFGYLGSTFMPSCVPTDGKMPDTLPAVAVALEQLSLANVQQHTVLSALLNANLCRDGATVKAHTPTTFKKLCAGIVVALGKVNDTLKSGTGAFFMALEASLHVYLRVSIAYFSALREIFAGVEADEGIATEQTSGRKSLHGIAIAYYTNATSKLTTISSNDAQQGIHLLQIRDCNPVLSEIKHHVALELTFLKEALQHAKKDNDAVFFEDVPETPPALPAPSDEGEAIFLPTSIAFQPPQPLGSRLLG